MKRLLTSIFIALISISSLASNQNDGLDPSQKVFEKWNKTYVSYPADASVENEQGLVYVSFEISVEGEMESIVVKSDLSQTLEEKAIEIVDAMPKAHLYENGFIEGTRFVLSVKFSVQ